MPPAGQTQPADASKVQEYIDLLNHATITTLLKEAAVQHPDINAKLENKITQIRERERNRVINFDHYSRSVWRSINSNKRGLSGSREYDMAFDVASGVSSTIESIAAQCNANSSAGTRYNGLSVLKEIGKTICLSNGLTASEVQKTFQWDHALEDGMRSIIEAMTPEERLRIRQDESGEEALWPKLVELDNLARNYCIFDQLGEVLDLLHGGYEDEGEDDEEDEDEEDDGDGDGN